MRLRNFFCAFVLASLPLQNPAAAAEPVRTHQQWKVYGGDSLGTKYSALNQINTNNVRQLAPAWVFRCDDMTVRPASTIECNPIIIDGVVFLTSPGLKVLALDAATGVRRWTFDPWNGQRGRGVNRGLTYWADDNGKNQRLFFAAGTELHAIEAETGQPVITFGDHGKIDLRDGLDRDVFFLSVTATSPGIIYKDLIILGSTVGEGPSPAAPGHIRAFDVRSGKRRWIFHTIPHPGEAGYETWPPDAWKTAGGANCWGGMTLDPARGVVFAGTGSATYDHYGGNRIGQNLYANCVLALNAATGERLWHYQVVHHDLWDYDIPCPPNLVTVRHNGADTEAVAQVTKTGHLFVLDRKTGQPLFPVEERPVPSSELPGEQTWPTQPFPVKPPPFAQQRFTEADVTDLTPASHAAVRTRLTKMRAGSVFLPPSLQASVALPQFNGGGEWGGAAFDPQTHLLYVNASNEAEWISMVPSKPSASMTPFELGQLIYGSICSACHGFEQAKNPAAPSFASLKSVKERLTKSQVLDLLATGRNQMPSFAALSDLERNAVGGFLFGEKSGEKLPLRDLKLSWAQEIPFVATGHHEFRDPEGFPANRRPWGTLAAIDLDRGEIKWQVPLGTYPSLEARGIPRTGTFNIGGSLVTAGGLVFIGAAMDERFHAYDKNTGDLLWEFQLDAGAYATPATYQIDGRQYVIVAAGGGGKPETKPGNAYYCFALPTIHPADALNSSQTGAERELIRDNHFRNGFILWEPKPGKHVPYGEVPGFDKTSKPVWGLSQWSSKFRLEPAAAAMHQDAFLVLSNAAKSVKLRRSDSALADLSLAVNTRVEYGATARRSNEPWVHLLVEQEFDHLAFLESIRAAKFHLDARLLRSRNLHHGDYSPAIHAAQFQVFFTVQNRKRKSPGYGDLLWFGIPIYDNRARSPLAFKSKDFGGTEKFIYTPEATAFTAESAHDGRWIVIDADLLPLMREALKTAWANGFLTASRDIADYAVGGMNMGWELPGTFDVELEVRNLSLKAVEK